MRTRRLTRNGTDAGLTPAQAAWLAEVPAKVVNAAIDKGETPVGRERRLSPGAVLYLMVRRETGPSLSREARRELYSCLKRSSLNESWTAMVAAPESDLEVALAGGVIRIELKTLWARLVDRWQALSEASELVVRDPEIRGGEPVIAGTRIPVYPLAEIVAKGKRVREVLEDYPALTQAKLRAAVAYAETNPRRGRPPAAPWRRMKEDHRKERKERDDL